MITDMFPSRLIGFSILGLVFNDFLGWLSALMIRQLGTTVAEAGSWVGGSILVFGTLGIYASGVHTNRHLQRGNDNGPIRTGPLAALWLFPISLLMLLMEVRWLKLVALCAFFLVAFPFAASAAAIQIASPPHLRAQVSALYLFCLKLVGIGLGATIIALITDDVLLFDAALPWAIALTAIVGVPVAAGVLGLCRAPFAETVALRQREVIQPGIGVFAA